MDQDLPTGRSTRPSSMGWWPRLLIALLLVLGYAFSYVIAPKIEASWTAPGPAGCELQLMPSVKDVSSIPTTGYLLVIVANVDHVLHFRIFDADGKRVVDTDETKLTAQAGRIEALRKQLDSLWPPQRPSGSEQVQVNAAVTAIAGYTWWETPRWVSVLSWCCHLFIMYVPAILLLLTAWILLRRGSPVWILLRRGSRAMKGKPLRLQLGIRTLLGLVALFAVTIALLHAWLLAPYQAEQHAAAALTQLGGKIVMVDTAPQWLRSYVGKGILNMDVAAVVDLSHSRVTDSDLVHLLAFHHCGQINLSDTQISNAGLTHLRKVAGDRWLDLSRTGVTDVAFLFGGSFRTTPAGLKLSGNRIARVEVPQKQWSPLRELDLSDTDIDDGTLASLANMVNLSDLNLCGTNVSDDGLLSLLPREGLTKLNLIDTKVTATGVARLKALWRYSPPLTIVTGTRKKAGGAPRTVPPQGTSGGTAAVR
jgi:hypothetical protein